LIPVFHGQAYYDKPPLLYWLVMASYRLFGVHDWSARLISSLAGVACVLATYWWGRRIVSPRTALAGAFILCLSPRYVYFGRMLTMNGLLGLWVTLSLASGHLALIGRRWPAWLLSAAACALGILTKGPVALVLVLVPLWLYPFCDRSIRRPPWYQWLLYLCVTLGLAAPWFVAVAARDPEFLRYFFWTHHVVRYVAPLDHEQPFWFYLPGFLLGMLPWTLLLPGMLRLLYRRWRMGEPLGAAGFFLLSALWCLLFYSASGCKRSYYILPAWPPLALALGWCLDQLLPARRTLLFSPSRLSRRFTQLILAMFVLLFAGILVLLPAYANRYSLKALVACSHPPATVPIICYPHRWDSVLFYTQRQDIRVYSGDQRPQLMANLFREPLTLVFVKSERSLREFLHDLPASLEWQPCGPEHMVTVGWVRSRR
jgi:4-amino-4-deoxy-L-arabinose transferase-like glycosyltransferase